MNGSIKAAFPGDHHRANAPEVLFPRHAGPSRRNHGRARRSRVCPCGLCAVLCGNERRLHRRAVSPHHCLSPAVSALLLDEASQTCSLLPHSLSPTLFHSLDDRDYFAAKREGAWRLRTRVVLQDNASRRMAVLCQSGVGTPRQNGLDGHVGQDWHARLYSTTDDSIRLAQVSTQPDPAPVPVDISFVMKFSPLPNQGQVRRRGTPSSTLSAAK